MLVRFRSDALMLARNTLTRAMVSRLVALTRAMLSRLVALTLAILLCVLR